MTYLLHLKKPPLTHVGKIFAPVIIWRRKKTLHSVLTYCIDPRLANGSLLGGLYILMGRERVVRCEKKFFSSYLTHSYDLIFGHIPRHQETLLVVKGNIFSRQPYGLQGRYMVP